MLVYLLTHDWHFANGEEGHYEVSFSDAEEAFSRFKYLQLLIENDEYDFNAHFTPYKDGDTSFSAFESADSLVNRQDLTLKRVEVSL